MSVKTQNFHPVSLDETFSKTEQPSENTNLMGGTLGKVIIFVVAFALMLVASQVSNL